MRPRATRARRTHVLAARAATDASWLGSRSAWSRHTATASVPAGSARERCRRGTARARSRRRRAARPPRAAVAVDERRGSVHERVVEARAGPGGRSRSRRRTRRSCRASRWRGAAPAARSWRRSCRGPGPRCRRARRRPRRHATAARVVRRREQLADAAVGADDVGERPAAVGSDPHPGTVATGAAPADRSGGIRWVRATQPQHVDPDSASSPDTKPARSPRFTYHSHRWPSGASSHVSVFTAKRHRSR